MSKSKYLPVQEDKSIQQYIEQQENKFICPLCNGTGLISQGVINMGCSCQTNTPFNNIRNESTTDWKNDKT